MLIEPEIASCSIVLLGTFNPLIVTPQWLEHWELLPNTLFEEAETTKDSPLSDGPTIASPDTTIFKVGKYAIHVQPERFAIETTQAPWVDVADLASRIFGEFLPHTPMHRFGINLTVHFSVGSEARRNAIGRLLAPTGPWGGWGREIDASPPDARGGLRNLTMLLPRRTEEAVGHIQVTIQPSLKIPENRGLWMQTNDDFGLPEAPKLPGGALPLMNLLLDEFDASTRRSEEIINAIMSLTETVS